MNECRLSRAAIMSNKQFSTAKRTAGMKPVIPKCIRRRIPQDGSMPEDVQSSRDFSHIAFHHHQKIMSALCRIKPKLV